MSESFDLNRELIKATITYLVPVIIGTGVSVFGPVADFAWSEVLRTWRGLVVLGTLILTALVIPRLSVWFAFAIFAGLLAGLYMTSLCYFRENEPEHKLRLNQMGNYIRPMKLFLHETIPEAMQPNDDSKTRAQRA